MRRRRSSGSSGRSVGLPSSHEFANELFAALVERYHAKLFKLAAEGRLDLSAFPGFLLRPDRIVIHQGETHIGVEYYGSEVLTSLPAAFQAECEVLDHRDSGMGLMESIIGFQIEGIVGVPTNPPLINAVIPTHAGGEAMDGLGWNYTAQSMIFAFNSGAPLLNPGEFGRVVNGLFFDGDGRGLITRHIKWLDLFPTTVEEIDDDTESFSIDLSILPRLVEADTQFAYPVLSRADFRNFRLPIINRFVETFGNPASSEPQITAFLAKPDHQFMLKARFGGVRMAAEVRCEWQSETRDAIIPDFFVVRADGYADIVEFKLPDLGGNAVVGKTNRERLSARLSEYVAQTRTYREYFEDPANRAWFEERHGFKVHHPRRFLVVGRRFDFTGDEWRSIVADYRDLEIVTFDDVVDTVTAQYYL